MRAFIFAKKIDNKKELVRLFEIFNDRFGEN